jgi:hypothetical protein
MRRLVITALLIGTAMLQTASLPSPTLKAWQRLRLMQMAGQVSNEWAIRGNTHAAQLEKLERWSEKRDYILTEARIVQKNIRGHTQHSSSLGWVILIDRDLEPDWQFTTLCHELAHVMTPKSLPPGTPYGEVFAEMVAVQVADGVGIDAWFQTASYLYAFASDEDQAYVMMKWYPDIDRVTAQLSKAVQP